MYVCSWYVLNMETRRKLGRICPLLPLYGSHRINSPPRYASNLNKKIGCGDLAVMALHGLQIHTGVFYLSLFIYFYSCDACLPAWGCVHHVHSGVHGGQKRKLDLLELEFRQLWDTMWILDIKPRPSAWVVTPLSLLSRSQQELILQVMVYSDFWKIHIQRGLLQICHLSH